MAIVRDPNLIRSRLRPDRLFSKDMQGQPQETTSALDVAPSKVGPSAPARYARRAMRQALRSNDPGLAMKYAQVLEDRGESDTLTSSEGRTAEDELQVRQDEIISREMESALSASDAPLEETESAAPARTPLSKLRGEPSTLRPSASLGAQPEAPLVPGARQAPENKITGATEPAPDGELGTLGQMSRRIRLWEQRNPSAVNTVRPRRTALR